MSLLVFICHPLRGSGKPHEFAKNKRMFRKICRFYIKNTDYLPLATALYFAEFLDDGIKIERKLGIRGGQALMKLCEEVHVFRMMGISRGMKEDISFAKKQKIKILFLDKYPWQ